MCISDNKCQEKIRQSKRVGYRVQSYKGWLGKSMLLEQLLIKNKAGELDMGFSARRAFMVQQ